MLSYSGDRECKHMTERHRHRQRERAEVGEGRKEGRSQKWGLTAAKAPNEEHDRGKVLKIEQYANCLRRE
jgi:hypothetical protein